VTVLASQLDLASAEYARNRAAQLELLARVDGELARVLAGGGERAVQRHRDRGGLTVRERLELLLDPDSPFLELSPLAAGARSSPSARACSPASASSRASSASSSATTPPCAAAR
jgi:acetyl-CoA carboxylase carboxyltransferase component